jgi:hypothetical protein
VASLEALVDRPAPLLELNHARKRSTPLRTRLEVLSIEQRGAIPEASMTQAQVAALAAISGVSVRQDIAACKVPAGSWAIEPGAITAALPQ